MDIGRKCHLGQKIKVVYPNNVKICDEVTVESGVRLWAETAEGKIYLGARCLVGRDCILDFSGGLNIGEETVISEQVIIYTHSHGYDPAGKPTASSLVVGDKAWIGARAIILSSVKRIGDRAIIGAGTVVTRDVPDDMIYVGAEGRVVKKEDEKGENNNSRT